VQECCNVEKTVRSRKTLVHDDSSSVTFDLTLVILDPRIDCKMDGPSPFTSVVCCSQYSFYIHICPLNDDAEPCCLWTSSLAEFGVGVSTSTEQYLLTQKD